ncbi:MAG: protein kinase [Isosphaerales bacterium]
MDDAALREDDGVNGLEPIEVLFLESWEAGDLEAIEELITANPRFAGRLRLIREQRELVEVALKVVGALAAHPGARIGRFRVVREMTRGHLGILLDVENMATGQRQALKILARDHIPSPDDVRRFEHQIELIRLLKHPRIIPIVEAGRAGGYPYFVMPWIEGADLRTWISRFRDRAETTHTSAGADPLAECPMVASGDDPGLVLQLDPGEPEEYARAIALIGVQVAEALHHAHEQGVRHRDVKPSNILLDESGQVILIDFDLAKQGAGSTRTPAGSPAGTFIYCAPERFRGVDGHRADIYSLGLVLQELLTLRPVFDPKSDLRKLTHDILHHPPLAARHLDPRIPRDLETIILKAVEKDEADRFDTAGAMAADLQRFLRGEKIQARRQGLGRQLAAVAGRNPGAAIASAVAAWALLLAIGLGFWSLRTEQKSAEARARVAEAERAAALTIERESEYQLLLGRIRGLLSPDRPWDPRDALDRRIREASGLKRDEALRDFAVAAQSIPELTHVEEILGTGASFLAFNADGSRLILGGLAPDHGGDAKARVWSVSEPRFLKECQPMGEGPVGFARNGTALQIVAPGDREVVLRDMDHDRIAARFPWPDPPAPDLLAMTPDGSRLAAAASGSPGTILVWNPSSKEPLKSMAASPTALALSPDGSLLAWGDERGNVRVQAILKEGPPLIVPSLGNRILALAFGISPRRESDGRPIWRLAVGDAGGAIEVTTIQRQTFRADCTCRGGDHPIKCLIFSPDGMLLASCGRGFDLWDAVTGTRVLRGGNSSDTQPALALSPDGLLAVTAHRGYRPARVDFWRWKVGRGISSLRGIASPIRNVVFAADGRRVAASADELRVAVWNRDPSRLVGVFDAPSTEYADNIAVAFDRSGNRLALSAGREARLYDVSSGRLERTWPLPEGFVDQLVFLENPERLILFRSEARDRLHKPYDNDFHKYPRVARAYDLFRSSWETRLFEYAGYQRLNHAALTPDGRMAVLDLAAEAENAPQSLVALGIPSGKVLWKVPLERTRQSALVSIDPTGRIATGRGQDPRGQEPARWWWVDLETGQKVRAGPPVNPALALGPIGSQGGLWLTNETSENDQRYANATFAIYGGGPSPLLRLGVDHHPCGIPAFSHDGRLLTYGATDGVVRVVDIEAVRQRLVALGLGWQSLQAEPAITGRKQ